jgi:hypothetical protein
VATKEGKKQPVSPKAAITRPQYRTVLNQGRAVTLRGKVSRGRL